MRIFNTALTREMASTGGVALVALIAIILVTLMVRTLGQAAVGALDNEAVLPFIGFGLVHFLPILLSLALFIGVFLTLARAWQDSEMVIWQAAGVGPLAWLSPVLRFALPVTLIIALLSLAIVPWMENRRTEYERFLSTRDETSSLTPGVFIESSEGQKVYFVESLSEENTRVRNVFIQSVQHGRYGVIVAAEGVVETMDNGDRFLTLSKGRRYEGRPGAADYRIMEFERYSVRIEPAKPGERLEKPRTLSTRSLLADPTPLNMAEWVWRLGYPLSALLLAVFAVPASHMNPRAGRSLNVIFAMLTYTVYNNLIGLSETWVAQQKIGAGSGMLLVHGGMLLLLAWLYWRRTRGPRGGRR